MSSEFDIEMDVERLKNLMSKGMDAVKIAFKYTAIDVWGELRKEAPVNHGRLAGSFQLKPVNDFEYHIQSGVAYALAVHTGTGIHGPEGRPIEIVPVNKKALYWPGAPHPVKRVLNPGRKADPYADRAMDNTSSRLDEFAQRAIMETMGATS